MDIQCSIVIPCYNSSKYLEDFFRYIPSISKFEFIFINDASTDETLSLLKNLISTKKHMSYKIINLKKNVGLAMAVYIGFQEITGKWFARLDPDDIPYPDYFSELPKYLNNNNKMVRFSFHTFNDGECGYNTKMSKVNWYDYRKIAFGWSCLFNLEYVQFHISGREFNRLDDMERFSKITMKNNYKKKKDIFISKNLVGYRSRIHSVSHTEKMNWNCYLQYKRIHKLYRKNKYIKFGFTKILSIRLFWRQRREMKRKVLDN